MVEIRPFSVVATLEPYAEYSDSAESNDQHDKHNDPAVVGTPPFRGGNFVSDWFLGCVDVVWILICAAVLGSNIP